MYKKFHKINDIKEKSDVLDFILFATIPHVEHHDKKELKSHVKTCIEYLNINYKTDESSIENIYMNRLLPLINSAKINIGNSSGYIKSSSILELSLDICLGLKILNENYYKKFEPDSEKLYNLQEQLLKKFQLFIELPLKKLTEDEIIVVLNKHKKIENKTEYISLESIKNLEKLKKILKYFFFNIPVILIVLWISVLSSHKIRMILPINPFDTTIFLGVIYSIGLLYYLIFLIIMHTNLLNLAKECEKNEKFAKFFKLVNKLTPNGLTALLTSIILGMLVALKENMLEFYNNIYISYLSELGTTISAENQNIVFEPVGIIGFNFLSMYHILIYLFKIISNYSFVLFLISMIICFFIKSNKKDNFKIILCIILLNAFASMLIMSRYKSYTNEILFKESLLYVELRKHDNHEIVITYPLLKDILKENSYKVPIKAKTSIIENKKLGLVSTYNNEELNIVHPAEVFCELRNFNLVNRDQATIGIYDLMDGFVTDNQSYTVDIKIKDPRQNAYDLEIENQTKTDTKKIENTQLEYAYDKVHFKKFDIDTGVYLKCKDSLYSKYFNNTKIGDEKFEGMDIIMDNMFKSVKLENNENIYMYKGRNINDLNPYKCHQKLLLNKKDDKKNINPSDIISSLCISSTKYFKEFLKNKLDQNKYD